MTTLKDFNENEYMEHCFVKCTFNYDTLKEQQCGSFNSWKTNELIIFDKDKQCFVKANTEEVSEKIEREYIDECYILFEKASGYIHNIYGCDGGIGREYNDLKVCSLETSNYNFVSDFEEEFLNFLNEHHYKETKTKKIIDFLKNKSLTNKEKLEIIKALRSPHFDD